MISLVNLNCRSICRNCRTSAFSYLQQRSLWISHQLYKGSHYETLELSSEATHSDIKTAYYRLSMKFHPDKHKGNEDKFKDLTTAYEVLGNPRLRRLYDKGIISHDHTSIHQHTNQDDLEPSKEQSESARASVRTFDQWSKNHTSATFARSQREKSKRANHARMKTGTSAQTGSEKAIWLLGLIAIAVAFFNLTSPWEESKKKS